MRIVFCVFVLSMLTLAALPQVSQRSSGTPPAAAVPQPMAAVVQTCVPCHGMDGEGRPALASPRIAGQSAYYLARQLDSYADGTRRDSTMEPIAKGLPSELRAAVAAHYAQAEASATASASTFTAPWAERGRVLAEEGDLARGVQACNNCHGPAGVGQPPAIPYLSGLEAGYIRATLIAWQEGRRSNDAGQQMAIIAKALSSEDVAAVARYYAGAAPPSPAPPDLVTAGRPQLVPPGMTKSMTVGTKATGDSGSEGRAPMAGGEGALAQSGASAGARGAGRTGGAAASGGTGREGGRPSGDRPVTLAADPTRGRVLVESGVYGCTACHTVPGIRAPRGIVGPPLGGIAQRPFLAGQLPNTFDVLAAFLRNPPSLVPATGMPNVGLSLEDARDVTAYLYTLPAEDKR